MKRTLISVKGRTRLLEKKVNAVLEKTTIELPDKDKIVIEWETITDSSGQKKTNWYSVIATRYKDGVIQDTLTDVPAAYLKFFVEREGYDVYTRELPIQKDHRERYYDKIKSFLGEYAWYFNYAKGTHPRFSRKPNNEKNEHGTSGASENVSENKPETSSSDPHKSADGLSLDDNLEESEIKKEENPLKHQYEGVWILSGEFSSFQGDTENTYSSMGRLIILWENNTYKTIYCYSVSREYDAQNIVTAICDGFSIVEEQENGNNILVNVNHLRGIRSYFSYCDRTSYHEEQKAWEQTCQV